MTEIFLDAWAKQNKIKKRTAQGWAKATKIPAKIKTVKATITRKVTTYVIDKNAPVPR